MHARLIWALWVPLSRRTQVGLLPGIAAGGGGQVCGLRCCSYAPPSMCLVCGGEDARAQSLTGQSAAPHEYSPMGARPAGVTGRVCREGRPRGVCMRCCRCLLFLPWTLSTWPHAHPRWHKGRRHKGVPRRACASPITPPHIPQLDCCWGDLAWMLKATVRSAVSRALRLRSTNPARGLGTFCVPNSVMHRLSSTGRSASQWVGLSLSTFGFTVVIPVVCTGPYRQRAWTAGLGAGPVGIS